MSKFFINRPIVAIVIAILMVMVGVISMLRLPVAQFPSIVPPEILVQAIYPGANAQTLEQSVATPLEEQISGVDNMNYMYSINANQRAEPDHRRLRCQHRFQYRSGAYPVARLAGAVPASGAGQRPPGCGAEIAFLAADVDCAVFAARHLRRLCSGQLRLHQFRRPVDAHARHCACSGFRRRPVCDALLGESRPACQAAGHRSANRFRAAGPEHRQSCRTNRRRACSEWPAVHLHRSSARPPDNRRTVWQHHLARKSRWLHSAAERRRPARARRANLQPDRPLQRQTGRDSRHLSTSRLQRRRGGGQRSHGDGQACQGASHKISTTK